jgi:tetratricopeptide (TPR) repeat protein
MERFVCWECGKQIESASDAAPACPDCSAPTSPLNPQASARPAPPRPGKFAAFDRLILERTGMLGQEWRAVDLRSKSPVLLTVLRLDPGASEAEVMSELRAASTFRNKRYVPILDFGIAEGCLWTSRPALEASPLSALARTDLPQTVRIVLTVAGLLDALHVEGLTHGALTLSSLLFDSRLQGVPAREAMKKAPDYLRIGHLGLPPMLTRAALEQAENWKSLAPFIAPELVYDGRKRTPRADVFSVGALFHTLLTGRPPYEADTREEMLECAARGRRRPLPDYLPSDLQGLVRRALDPDPARRQGSMRELAAELKAVFKKKSAPEGAGGGPTLSWKRWMWIPAAALLALGAAAAAWLYAPEPSSRPPPSRSDPELARFRAELKVASEKIRELRASALQFGAYDEEVAGRARTASGRLERLPPPYRDHPETRYHLALLKEIEGDIDGMRGHLARGPLSGPAALLAAKYEFFDLATPESLAPRPSESGEYLARAFAPPDDRLKAWAARVSQSVDGLSEPLSILRRALLQFAAGDLSGSSDLLLQLKSDAEADDATLDLAGRVLLAAWRAEASVEWLDRAAKLRPTAQRWALLSIATFLSTRDTEAAAALLEKGLQLDPHLVSRLEVGWLGVDSGRILEAGVQRNPAEPRLLAAWLDYLLHFRSAGEALEAAHRWVSFAPVKPEPHAARARCWLKLGQEAPARESLARAIELDSRDPWVHARMGQWRLEEGDDSGAQKALDRAVELDPASPRWLEERARIRRSRADPRGALEDLRRALALAPERMADPGFLRSFGAAHRRDGQIGPAARLLEQSLDLAPGDPEGRFERAIARWREEDLEGCARDLGELMRRAGPSERKKFLLLRWAALSLAGRAAAAAEELEPAARAADSVWPSDLLRVAAGLAAEAEVDRALGPEQTERRCELYFYSGVRRLLEKDDSTYRRRWAWCAETRLGHLPEVELAAHPRQIRPPTGASVPPTPSESRHLEAVLAELFQFLARSPSREAALAWVVETGPDMEEWRRLIADRIPEPVDRSLRWSLYDFQDSCAQVVGYGGDRAAIRSGLARVAAERRPIRTLEAVHKAASEFPPGKDVARVLALVCRGEGTGSNGLEEAIRLLLERDVSVFVIGPEASLGWAGRSEPASRFASGILRDVRVGLDGPGLEILQASPLCCLARRCRVNGRGEEADPWLFHTGPGEEVLSGCGPYSLARLAFATEGAYRFFRPPSRALSPAYAPELVSREQWAARNGQHPLRQAVSRVAALWPGDAAEFLSWRVATTDLQPHDRGRLVARAEQVLSRSRSLLGEVERSRFQRFESAGARWEACADLIEAQLAFLCYQLEEYRYLLSSAPLPLKLKEGDCMCVLTQRHPLGTGEIVYAGDKEGRPTASALARLKEKLDRVRIAHKDTPWADAASRLADKAVPLRLALFKK